MYYMSPTAIEVTEQHKTCDNCTYWLCTREEVYAKTGYGIVRVGQCVCSGDDNAPYAEVLHGEAFVFTQARSSCAAFEISKEALEEAAAEAAYKRDLNRERTRDTMRGLQ